MIAIESSVLFLVLGTSVASSLLLATGCAPDEVSLEPPARAATPASASLEPEAHVPLRELLAASLSHSQEGLDVVPRSDGLEHVRITSGFRHAQIVVKLPDGGLARRCTHDADEAMELLEHGAP